MKYELIERAKAAVCYYFEDLENELDPVSLADMCRNWTYNLAVEFYRADPMRDHSKKPTYKEQIALVTVLATSTYEDTRDGWRFYMPSTRECLDNFNNIKKKLKKHEAIPLYGYFYKWNQNWETLERVDRRKGGK